MKKIMVFAGITSLSFSVFISCTKDNKQGPVKPTLAAVAVTNLDADAANLNKFTLFSLANNQIVPNNDSATTKWDIGFKSTRIIVNGGVSGPGEGAAKIVSGVFSNITEAPEEGYVTDAVTTKAITGWYTYNQTTHVITPVPGTIILLKTATGKYVKLEITSYYKDAPATPDESSVSRKYHFRYVLQQDGTRNFK